MVLRPLDWLILALLAGSALAGLGSGFFVSFCSLAGLAAGLLLAASNYPAGASMLEHVLGNRQAAQAAAFLLIALAVMLACGLAGRLLRSLFRLIGLGWADRLMGAAFGLLRGAAIVTLIIVTAAAFLPRRKWFDESRLAGYFLSTAHATANITPGELSAKIRSGLRKLEEERPAWLPGPQRQ